jgi:N6-adenosine-specific RNA methylase IME4
MRIGEYDTHPAADVFPLLEGPEFEALCADIAEHGLREPITRMRLKGLRVVLDGRNRLRACAKVGVRPHWREFEGDSPAAFVVSLNLKRRNLTKSQAVACAVEMLPVFEAEARARQGHGSTAPGKGRTLRDPGPRALEDEKRAREQAATQFGVSGRHVQRGKKLKQMAPQLLDAVKAGKMDLGTAVKASRLDDELRRVVLGQVEESKKPTDGKQAVRSALRQQATARIESEPAPLPVGPFRVIVADPPWAYEKRKDDGSHRAALTYPSMITPEICALPLGERAHEHSVLWLWTTNAFMRDAFQVIDAWGFKEKTILTWAKDRMGTGDWLRGKTEHCVLAVRGAPHVNLTNQTTLLSAPVREHSRKPDEFYQLVEALCPGSKLEVFARQQRPGWIVWGAESEKFDAA